MNRRSFLQTLGSSGGVAVVVGLAGCVSNGSPDDTEPVEGTLVEMANSITFEPETVTVPAGETVGWRNVGAAPHTVTAYENEIPPEAAYFASGGFESEQAARDGYAGGNGVIEGNEEYEPTFDVPGRYDYFCMGDTSTSVSRTNQWG